MRFSSTKCINHWADSANFKGITLNKLCGGLTGKCFEMPNASYTNRIVTAFLEIAEIQALNQTPMYMKDWIEQLDSFLKMTKKDVLSNAGNISHQKALQKAHSEYEKYKELKQNELSEVEKHFIKQIADMTKKLKNEKEK